MPRGGGTGSQLQYVPGLEAAGTVAGVGARWAWLLSRRGIALEWRAETSRGLVRPKNEDSWSVVELPWMACHGSKRAGRRRRRNRVSRRGWLSNSTVQSIFWAAIGASVKEASCTATARSVKAPQVTGRSGMGTGHMCPYYSDMSRACGPRRVPE